MKLKRLLAILILPVVAMFVLAGCAVPKIVTGSDKPDTAETDAPAEEDDEPAAPADGELAEPGTRVGANEWLTHSFVGTDDQEALIASRLISVEPVTKSQLAFLNETFDEGELEGYDVWMVIVEEQKISGASIEFDSDYSYYDVVDADGDQVQGITVIGWDECSTESFDEEFDTNGGILTQCFLGAAPSTDTGIPAGVAYTGGYEDDNPYDSYDGKPLLFIKD